MFMMKLIFLALGPSLNPAVSATWLSISLMYLYICASQSTFIISPELDFYSLALVMLTGLLSLYMVQASLLTKNVKLLILLLKALYYLLACSFFASSFLGFYFFFEAALIPIFWMILGWGYQPERLLASMMMMFYTLVASLPLLLTLILTLSSSFQSGMMNSPGPSNVGPSSWLSICLTMAFLVKFPMYLVHTWLPKAHVEAPVAGSMILAGILLKLGGYGLYRLAPYFFVGPVNQVAMLVSAFGGALLSCLCCRMTDMKVIIAYSSVVHMSLVIVAVLNLEGLGLAGVWWTMLAHGLTSSGLFAGANVMYCQSHSRSTLLNKGGLTSGPAFGLFFFMLMVLNFSGPFTLNLYGEINLILSTLSSSIIFLAPVFIITFFSAAYSLVLYSTTQQGPPAFLSSLLNSVNAREMSILWGHLWPAVALLGALNI